MRAATSPPRANRFRGPPPPRACGRARPSSSSSGSARASSATARRGPRSGRSSRSSVRLARRGRRHPSRASRASTGSSSPLLHLRSRPRGRWISLSHLRRFDHDPRAIAAETIPRELDCRSVRRVADALDEQDRRATLEPERPGVGRPRLCRLQASRQREPVDGRSPPPSGRTTIRRDPCPRCRGRAEQATTTARLRAACHRRDEAGR